MAHGQPDDSHVVSTDVVFTLSDLAEAVVRLGSPAVMARSGAVLMAETWAAGLGSWALNTSGAPSYARISNKASLWDGVSLCLYADVGAALFASVQKQLPLVSPGVHGLSLWFAGAEGSGSLMFRVTATIGGTKRQYTIMVYPATGVVAYVDDAGVDQTVVTLGALDDNAEQWHSLKLVIDDVAEQYKELWLGTTRYALDVPGQPLVGVTEQDRITMRVQCTGAAASDQIAYFDGIVLTGKEV